jgi:hypothetical protein
MLRRNILSCNEKIAFNDSLQLSEDYLIRHKAMICPGEAWEG